METKLPLPPLTWHQTIARFSYYSLGIAGVWGLAFVLFAMLGFYPR